MITKATRTRCLLFSVLNRNSPLLSLKIKLNIHQLYIRPIIIYAGEAWGSQLTKRSWNKVEAIQTKCLHLITSSPKYVANQTILNSARLPTLEALINRQTRIMFHKNLYSNFVHIRQLSRNEQLTTRNKKTRPLDWSSL